MPNKCCIFGCNTCYETCKEKDISAFSFPSLEKEPVLAEQRKRFVNRSDWSPCQNSVVCEKHFDPKFIIRGKERTRLKQKLKSCTNYIYTGEALKRPSTLPTPMIPRKAPKLRVYQEDQFSDFLTLFRTGSCACGTHIPYGGGSY